MSGLNDLRVAIVHDYLVDRGGAERVVLVLHELFPQAPIYTSIFDARTTLPEFRTLDVRTTWLQRLGFRRRTYKLLLPFYPRAFEDLRLDGYDLVMSSTTSFAKGVLSGPGTLHVSYCNTPTRFLWWTRDYLARQSVPRLARPIAERLLRGMREWDYAAAQRVHHFIAGSRNAADRIRKYYRREATVIHSPIDVRAFAPTDDVGEFFLVVSRLVLYKRIDLAIEAFNRLRLPLWIVGEGPAGGRLRSLAGPTVRFLGWQPDTRVRELLARCRALVLPGEEDFGLTPLEANASGRPVVAYAGGGALETVTAETGILFREPTSESLAAAVRVASSATFDREILRAHAARFDKEIFKERVREFVAARLQEGSAA